MAKSIVDCYPSLLSILECTMIYCAKIVEIFFFSDIINCEDDDGCHDNATCTDDNGSYICICQDGFTGDGFNCTGLLYIA